MISNQEIQDLYSNIFTRFYPTELQAQLLLVADAPGHEEDYMAVMARIVFCSFEVQSPRVTHLPAQIAILERVGSKYPELQCLRWIEFFKGYIFQREENIEKALLCYRNALSKTKESEKSIRSAIFLQMALLHNRYGSHESAIDCLEKALQYALPSRSVLTIQKVYFHLSEIYATLLQFDKALDTCRKGIQYCEDNDTDRMKLQLQIRETTILVELGFLDETLASINKLRGLLPENVKRGHGGSLDIVTGKVFRLRKQFDKSLEHIQAAIADFRQTGRQ